MNLNGDLTNKQRLQQQLIAPQVDMVGDWTPEKWDCWVTQARQHGWLSVDELALVSHGLMMGQIAGQCQLYMSDENKQTVVSFEGFLSKYATLMPDAQLLGYQILTDDMRCQVPVVKQQQRKTVVDTQIEQQLLQSPVLTQLWQMGYIEQTGASIMVVKSFLE
ncbi:hypothetical protein CEW93_004100 [Moraxella sp. VT-16-12]|nr:hypothetical protein CEW93_004100 [Moraxella sp. VT-16-12]